jgi:hypothetical protein
MANLLPFLLVAAMAGVTAQDKPSGSLTDVTGVWIMLVAGHQIGLELDQKGTKVEGVMMANGQRTLLVGTYEERTLTLKGEKPPDGAEAPPSHLNAGPITAKMLDNGTLEGELSTIKGRMNWTGERLQKR